MRDKVDAYFKKVKFADVEAALKEAGYDENWYTDNTRSQPMQCEKCKKVQMVCLSKGITGGVIVSCNYCKHMQVLEVEKNESGND